jgi:hypothetical protein
MPLTDVTQRTVEQDRRKRNLQTDSIHSNLLALTGSQ